MSLESLVPLGVFLAIALAVWGGLSAYAEARSRASDRLDRLLKETGVRRGPTTLMKKQDRIQAIVAKAAPALSRPLQPSNEEEMGKLRLELLNAGFRGENAPQIYLAIRFFVLMVALAIAIPPAYAKYGWTLTTFKYVVVGAGFGFYLPVLVLGQMKKKRIESIFLGLPDALDLMVVCVEAGLSLDAAMRRVANELAESCQAICEEFAISNFQIQMGRPRKDVLHDLGRRTGVDDVRSLAAVLIQAERFGASIATALRVQSDAMRIKRRQLAEERAAKTAVLLLLPLVLFIFPGIFVVLVGPAGIQISETLMKQ